MLWMLWLAGLMILAGAFGLTLSLASYAESAVEAWHRRYPQIEDVLYRRG